MIQRTVMHQATPAARVEAQRAERAILLTFLAVAFGVVLAGGIVPVVIHTILGMVLRTISGA